MGLKMVHHHGPDVMSVPVGRAKGRSTTYIVVEPHLQPPGVPAVIDGLCREGKLVLQPELEVHTAKVDDHRLLAFHSKSRLVACFVDSGEQLNLPLIALHPHGPFEDG